MEERLSAYTPDEMMSNRDLILQHITDLLASNPRRQEIEDDVYNLFDELVKKDEVTVQEINQLYDLASS